MLRSRWLELDLDEELEFHRQMRLRRARESGLTDEQAKREAKRRMGNVALAKDEMRDARVVTWLATSLQDLRHGVVLLRRDAGVSALIILVLALGIGGNAAIFTLLKAAFLNPLPYPNAGRLVSVLREHDWAPSIPEFAEIQTHSRTLEQVAYIQSRDMQLSGTGEPLRVSTAHVTASFFRLLGAKTSLGRALIPQENQPNQILSVVLSDAFWRSQMSSDSNVVGRVLRLDGQSALVVGVLSPGFHFDYPTLRIPEPIDLYVSYPIDKSAAPQLRGANLTVPARVLGRLQEGFTLAQAESELREIGQAIAREYPLVYHAGDRKPKDPGFEIMPLRDAIVGGQRSLLWLLWGGVAILLLIACANTSQLLLARSLRRRREIAIRAALGASRPRLIRQFVLEAVVLAACGCIAGLCTAPWIVRLLVAILPARSPLLDSAHLDTQIVALTLLISLFSAVGFAIIPALKSSRWSPGVSIQARASGGEGNQLRQAMIAFETALSMFLLCGAGLVVQNLWTLISSPMGFDPNHVLAMRLKLPHQVENSLDTNAGGVLHEYLEKIASTSGVESVAAVTGPPLRQAIGGPTEIAGEHDSSGALKSVMTDLNQVSPDYFRTLRIPLLAGRLFRNDDVAGRPLVAVVNHEFARRFQLGVDVVGKRLADPGKPITIIGMVGDVRTRGLDTAPYPEIYLSFAQFSWANVYLVVRSELPPTRLIKVVKTAIESANSDQAVFGVMTMNELIADSVTEPRFYVFLIGAFAALAVMMAAGGMYSVISFLVSQRTNEIAIRLALGASRSAIARIIVGSTAVWVLTGLVCGLGLGLACKNVVRALSSATVQGSPWMYIFVALSFFLLTLLAAYVPMRRAIRLDPAMALHCD